MRRYWPALGWPYVTSWGKLRIFLFYHMFHINLICLQMDRFGRKKTLLITEIPLIIGWLMIAMATNIQMIYIGRLLMGLGSGLVGAPARVYTSEVTQPHLRGMLSAMAAACISFGVLLQYTIGSFASWHILSSISAIIPTIALFSMCLMWVLNNFLPNYFFFDCFFSLSKSFLTFNGRPESPNYLVSRSKPEKAAKSLSRLRGSKYNIQREVDHLQGFVQKSQMNK